MNFHWVLILPVTLVAMEFAVTLFHKHVMHGIGWTWHASHHAPAAQANAGRPSSGWERNDWFAVVFTLATIAFFAVVPPFGALWWVAFGITLYGLLYGILHDGITHRRLAGWGFTWQPRQAYLRRLIAAHRMHHAVHTREDGVSFGFLYAPPVETLKQELKEQLSRQRERSPFAQREPAPGQTTRNIE
ncbi:sterol desaturase family protein [Noviherbaspirillum galbum]|uniref:Beta-carotene hydroxylase n=1 Tax=Noviherbaspirillum galbum TaxID=2709383 RepID=A0A6B3SG07_9BURK|nr:beta-carotene hydroxylase [Noviherbaspirillum galbum]NEX59598.1 beta-carotene hydroxylase [Noviherbaspirillum galbum]